MLPNIEKNRKMHLFTILQHKQCQTVRNHAVMPYGVISAPHADRLIAPALFAAMCRDDAGLCPTVCIFDSGTGRAAAVEACGITAMTHCVYRGSPSAQLEMLAKQTGTVLLPVRPSALLLSPDCEAWTQEIADWQRVSPPAALPSSSQQQPARHAEEGAKADNIGDGGQNHR